MAFESITDEKIKELLAMAKQVTNANTRQKAKPGHTQRNYHVKSTDGSDFTFELFVRQNTNPGMEDDFSAGLSWLAPNGEPLILCRYNGGSHGHPNHLEKTTLPRAAHIHKASERYVRAGKKAEGFAETTERYTTADGALHCLVKDNNITGIRTTPDDTAQINLFIDPK